MSGPVNRHVVGMTRHWGWELLACAAGAKRINWFYSPFSGEIWRNALCILQVWRDALCILQGPPLRGFRTYASRD